MNQPNFDRVARIYRWAEYLSLGPLLQRTRTHFLPQLLDRRRVLALGDGDGRFLARLLQQNRGLQAVAVDTSAKMLALLERRCHAVMPHDTNRLRTWQGSALNVTPAKDTDLITTHFFLDCLTQPEVDTLTRTLASTLNPGALWLLSDFALPHPRLLQPLAALYIRALYLAFRLLTGLRVTHLPDPQSSLRAAGFTLTIPPQTDLITTHFFLDCLTQPEVDTLTQTIAGATQRGTLWLLSDFRIPQTPLAPFARVYIRTLYLAFRILTNLRVQSLPNPQHALQRAGFTRIARHQRLFGLIYSEIWRHD